MNNFMEEALRLAKQSFDEGEVPVGAVVVKDGEPPSSVTSQV